MVNTGAGGGVRGQVKLPSVMDPLQGLKIKPIRSPHSQREDFTLRSSYYNYSLYNGLIKSGGGFYYFVVLVMGSNNIIDIHLLLI